MQPRSSQILLDSVLSLLMAFLLFMAMSTSAAAHGKAHQPKGEMSEHMQSMLELKEGIPEEFGIMERTPILPSEESLQQGEKLFLQNCSVCHGEKGDGKGSAATALETPPANFLDKKHSAMYGPGEKYWIVSNGSGKTGMPAFSQLSSVERWHLVNFILNIQEENQDDLEDLFSPK